MTPGLVDPRMFQGPFSEILQQPKYEAPGPRGYSGLGGTREALLKLATDFLGGVSKGRLEKFQAEENKKAQVLGTANAFLQMVQSHPELTQDAKDQMMQQYSQYVGAKVNQEMQAFKPDAKTPQGAILNLMKSFASNLAGTPPKGSNIDVEGLQSMVRSGAASLSDPKMRKQTYLDEGFKEMQTAVTDAAAQAKQEGRILTIDEVQTLPAFQGGVRKLTVHGSPELVNLYARLATGGIPAMGSREYQAAEEAGITSEAQRKFRESQGGAPMPERSPGPRTAPPPVGTEGIPDEALPWMRATGQPPVSAPPTRGGFIPEIAGTTAPPVGATPTSYRSFLPKMTPAKWVEVMKDRDLPMKTLEDSTGRIRQVYLIPGSRAYQGGAYDATTGQEITEPLAEPTQWHMSEKVGVNPATGQREYVETWTNPRTRASKKIWSGIRAPDPEHPGSGAERAERRREEEAAAIAWAEDVPRDFFTKSGYDPQDEVQRITALLDRGMLRQWLKGTEHAKHTKAIETNLRQRRAAAIRALQVSNEGAAIVTEPRKLTDQDAMSAFGSLVTPRK